MTTAPTLHSSSSNTASAITLRGSPVVYSCFYPVNDAFGTFQEKVVPAALRVILPTSDTKSWYNHDGLTLARTTSGTLVLTDSPTSLNCDATLDPRMTVAADLALAVGRGDINQMSVGFRVGSDDWNDDFSVRVITSFSALVDVSAVCAPASPSTSVELLEAPEHLQPVGGPDGTLDGGGGNAPGLGNQDGTGSRSSPNVDAIMRAAEASMALPPDVARLQLLDKTKGGAGDEICNSWKSMWNKSDIVRPVGPRDRPPWPYPPSMPSGRSGAPNRRIGAHLPTRYRHFVGGSGGSYKPH